MGSRNDGPPGRMYHRGSDAGGGQDYYDDHGGGGGRNHGHHDTDGSMVVMIYGVDQAKMNCDMLFNILCLYGNVERVSWEQAIYRLSTLSFRSNL